MEETERLLADLVRFPTVSSDSNLDLIRYIETYLSEFGARCSVFHDETGGKANIFATLGPDGDGGIVLSGHTDVVPVEDQDWTSDPFEIEERGGLLYGRGTCDMKGFIACALSMAPAFAALDLKRPVHFAFTYDEEVGCIGGQALVDELVAQGLKPSIAIIGEPTQMRIINGHKGCRETHTHFKGLAGHSSQPDQGVNAVEFAVQYASKIMEVREALKARAPVGSPFEPPWSTMQVGQLHGGVAVNVIPETATLEWDLRAVQPEDKDFVDGILEPYVADVLVPAMKEISEDADIEVDVVGDVVGLVPMDDSEAVKLVAELTGANGTDVVAFGTEAGIFQNAGVSAVVCGPGSIAQAHKADEFISRDQLVACLEMLDGLKARLV